MCCNIIFVWEVLQFYFCLRGAAILFLFERCCNFIFVWEVLQFHFCLRGAAILFLFERCCNFIFIWEVLQFYSLQIYVLYLNSYFDLFSRVLVSFYRFIVRLIKDWLFFFIFQYIENFILYISSDMYFDYNRSIYFHFQISWITKKQELKLDRILEEGYGYKWLISGMCTPFLIRSF